MTRIISFIIPFLCCAFCNGQNILVKKEIDTVKTTKTNSISNYKNPKNDFVTFNILSETGLYTGKINYQKLKNQADFAICCMGIIPLIHVTYYNEGSQSGSVQVGFSNFASEIKLLTKKTDTFQNLNDYTNKREKLLAANNTYILHDEITYNKKYTLTWYEF